MKASLSKMKKQVQRGFTLVEIAIVLVIIGLLIGGVLRGQELLNSARANSVSSQLSSIQTAYYGFIDRYKAMPGDLTGPQALAVSTLTVAATVNAGDSQVTLADSPVFFNNLSQAGFLACTPCTPTAGAEKVSAGANGATYAQAPTTLTTSNTMTNVFGSPLLFLNDTTLGTGGATAGQMAFFSATAEPGRPMISTGGALTSGMLAELDRKADDGVAGGGSLRISDLQGTAGFSLAAAGAGAFTTAAASGKCAVLTATAATWVTPSSGPCQGAFMF